MSLRAGEQYILESIEGRLARSAPELAARLGMFSRLTSGEKMPGRETIRAGLRWPAHPRSSRSGPGSGATQLAGRRTGRQQALLLIWLSTAVALIVTALMINHVAVHEHCVQRWAAVGAGQVMAPCRGLAAACRGSRIYIVPR